MLDRLVTAGIARDRAEEHLRSGRVRVDGVPVTEPNHPAARPARVVLAGDAPTTQRPRSSGETR